LKDVVVIVKMQNAWLAMLSNDEIISSSFRRAYFVLIFIWKILA